MILLLLPVFVESGFKAVYRGCRYYHSGREFQSLRTLWLNESCLSLELHLGLVNVFFSIGYCASDPCLNGGTCIPAERQCACSSLYAGTSCNINQTQDGMSSMCSKLNNACLPNTNHIRFQSGLGLLLKYLQDTLGRRGFIRVYNIRTGV